MPNTLRADLNAAVISAIRDSKDVQRLMANEPTAIETLKAVLYSLHLNADVVAYLIEEAAL